MLTRLSNWRTCWLVGSMVLISVAGCRKEEPEKEQPASDAKVDAKVKVNVKVKVKVEAKLAKADQVDGTADKIVSKCPACALGMDGKSEHALQVSGYTLHFCSEKCKTEFEKDTTKSILDLKIPEG